MVEIAGASVEYIETELSEEEIWDCDQHKNSILYNAT